MADCGFSSERYKEVDMIGIKNIVSDSYTEENFGEHKMPPLSFSYYVTRRNCGTGNENVKKGGGAEIV